MHVAGDALYEVLDRHRGAEVGAVAGALVGRVINQGAAVGQLKGDWKVGALEERNLHRSLETLPATATCSDCALAMSLRAACA